MRDDYFFDGDGQPLTGKIPLHVRFKGSGDPNLIRGHANAALRAFLANVRNSLAPTHRKTIALPNGTMTMWHSYGSTRVEIELTGGLVQEEEFYGGILIRPQYLPDESVFFGGEVPGPFDRAQFLVPYGEIKTSGARSGTTPLAGRPAIPGVPPGTQTEWLVVQIAKDKPLGSTPIKDGTVKIFRLPTLNTGDVAESGGAPGKYLLSANRSTGVFYLGNKVVQSIPASPTVTARVEVIATFGTAYASLAQTNLAETIVIAVTRDASSDEMVLRALDTASRTASVPAVWAELARAARPQYGHNAFGDVTKEVAQNGTATITCSGSNGAGVMSGFVVTITPNVGGRPTITGALSLMGNGFVPGTPGATTVSWSTQISPTASNQIINARFGPDPNSLDVNGLPTGSLFADFKFSSVNGITTTDAFGTYESATPDRWPDYFLGGYLPTLPTVYAEWNSGVSREATTTNWRAAPSFRDLGGNGFLHDHDATYEADATYRWWSAYFSPPAVTMTAQRRQVVQGGVTVVNTDTESRSTVDLSLTFPIDPVNRFSYLTYAGGLAMRLESYQQGRGEAAGPSFNSNSVLETYDEAVATMQLITKTGDAVYSWPDVFSLFPVSKPARYQQRSAYDTCDYAVLAAPIVQYSYPFFYTPTAIGARRWRLVGATRTNFFFPPPGIVADDIDLVSFSLTYSYSGEGQVYTITPAQIGATFPSSVFALFSDGDVIYNSPSTQFDADIYRTFRIADYPATNTVNFGFPLTQGTGGKFSPSGLVSSRWSVGHTDPRTGGYIMETSLLMSVREGDGSPVVNAVVSVIGNRFGAQPLQPVIEEWRELGEKETAFNATLGQIGPTGDGKTAIIYLEAGFTAPTYLL